MRIVRILSRNDPPADGHDVQIGCVELDPRLVPGYADWLWTGLDRVLNGSYWPLEGRSAVTGECGADLLKDRLKQCGVTFEIIEVPECHLEGNHLVAGKPGDPEREKEKA